MAAGQPVRRGCVLTKFVNMNREKALYISVIICLSFQLACTTSTGEEDISKMQPNFVVLGHGFHRELQVFSSFLPSSLEVCKILIKWVIPPGIYVDPYQLRSSIMNQTVHLSSNVNIEQMAHRAEPVILHSFPSLHCSSSCHFSQTIQFHLRYHLPRSNNDYTKMSLTSPVTYFSCDCNSPIDLAVKKCSWEKLPDPKVLQHDVFVPIGDLSHLPFVTFLTIAVSFIGTSCVAFASIVQ